MKPTQINPYGAQLWVATSRKQWAKIRETIDALPAEPAKALGSTSTVFWHAKRGASTMHLVVWVDKRAHHKDPVGLVATAAHEAVHVAQALFEHIGHTPVGSDEPTAYLVDWTLTQILDRL